MNTMVDQLDVDHQEDCTYDTEGNVCLSSTMNFSLSPRSIVYEKNTNTTNEGMVDKFQDFVKEKLDLVKKANDLVTLGADLVIDTKDLVK
jgi:hypothetical protein